MNSLLLGVFILFYWFNSLISFNFPAHRPLLSIARAITEDKRLNEKKFKNKGANFVSKPHKKESLTLSSPAKLMAELVQLSSNGAVEILREEQIGNAKAVVEKIQKAALRALSCRKGAVRACRKACKAALKSACTVYKCRSRLKHKFKKQCKRNCNVQYSDM